MAYLAVRGMRRGQRREPSAWRGQPPDFSAAVSAPADGRSAGRPRDQWHPHAELGHPRRRCALDRLLAARTAGWEPRTPWAPRIRDAADSAIWQCRTAARKSLVDYARERLSAQLAASGGPPEEIDGAKHLFDPDVLTLGFARRFATYKRPNLLLNDPERLARLLTNPRAADATDSRRQGASG